jgi:membrane-associated phospholipid phosphatase
MRVSEWIAAAFFSWTTVLAIVLPISGNMRLRTFLANAIVVLVYGWLFRMRRHTWAEMTRDWVAQALTILAYKQMGWFAPATHTYALEHEWIVWDRLLLDGLHGRAIVEFFGPVLPSILELSYSLVYAVPPVTMGILYATGLRKRADAFLTIYVLGLFLCYGQFPFWPSEPPRAVFPGQDMPSIDTVFRQFNLWLVENYGIHTSVFPSAHVSGVFAAAFAVSYVTQRRRLFSAYLIYAILVALATVYGRYHYAVDAVGGFVIGSLAWPLGAWLLSRAERRRACAGAVAAKGAITPPETASS